MPTETGERKHPPSIYTYVFLSILLGSVPLYIVLMIFVVSKPGILAALGLDTVVGHLIAFNPYGYENLVQADIPRRMDPYVFAYRFFQIQAFTLIYCGLLFSLMLFALMLATKRDFLTEKTMKVTQEKIRENPKTFYIGGPLLWLLTTGIIVLAPNFVGGGSSRFDMNTDTQWSSLIILYSISVAGCLFFGVGLYLIPVTLYWTKFKNRRKERRSG